MYFLVQGNSKQILSLKSNFYFFSITTLCLYYNIFCVRKKSVSVLSPELRECIYFFMWLQNMFKMSEIHALCNFVWFTNFKDFHSKYSPEIYDSTLHSRNSLLNFLNKLSKIQYYFSTRKTKLYI